MKNKLLARKIEKEKVSMSEKNQAENNNGYKFEDDDKYPSTFTGGAFAYFFINLFMLFITLITLGIAYPAVKCMYMRWEVKNTYINGRKLAFDGKGGQLFGKYILWLVLCVITLGIYAIFVMPLNLVRWQTKHTYFEGERAPDEPSESKFTGTWPGLFGINFVTILVTIITLGLGSFWAQCYKQRWFSKHKIIDGHPLYFTGTGIQFFGKCIVWILLTVITIGIYSFWLAVKIKKWLISHTHVKDPAMLKSAPASF